MRPRAHLAKEQCVAGRFKICPNVESSHVPGLTLASCHELFKSSNSLPVKSFAGFTTSMLALAKRQSLRRLEQSCLQNKLLNGFRAARQCRVQSAHLSTANPKKPEGRSPLRPWIVLPTTLLVFCGAGVWAYDNYQPFRHTLLAAARCSRIAGVLRLINILVRHIYLSAGCR